MKIAQIFASAAALFFIAAAPNNTHEEAQTIAQQNNLFAYDLYQQISSEEDGNIFFSPFSISTALAMTYAGADGVTADEMQHTMHFAKNTPAFHNRYGKYLSTLEKNAKGTLKLRIANRLWAEKTFSFKKSFLTLAETDYGAKVEWADFKNKPEENRKKINTWVENKTEDRIKNLLAKGVIDETTRMVLVNAIYFKGDWQTQFDEQNTKPKPFYLQNGGDYETPFLQSSNHLAYVETGKYKMVKLPYEGNKHSMIVVLPNKTKNLQAVAEEFGNKELEAIFNANYEKVNFAMPKFKTTLTLMLSETLQKMEMKNPFSDFATFTKMRAENDVKISEVVHKAFIEVSEKGTEAAAATAVVMVETTSALSRPEVPKTFVADHPFLFYIVDNETKAILFMGRMMEPKVD